MRDPAFAGPVGGPIQQGGVAAKIDDCRSERSANFELAARFGRGSAGFRDFGDLATFIEVSATVTCSPSRTVNRRQRDLCA